MHFALVYKVFSVLKIKCHIYLSSEPHFHYISVFFYMKNISCFNLVNRAKTSFSKLIGIREIVCGSQNSVEIEVVSFSSVVLIMHMPFHKVGASWTVQNI